RGQAATPAGVLRWLRRAGCAEVGPRPPRRRDIVLSLRGVTLRFCRCGRALRRDRGRCHASTSVGHVMFPGLFRAWSAGRGTWKVKFTLHAVVLRRDHPEETE
ncbi:unnamed protein product, partial [Hapterophycus canaliculatus]